MLRIFLRRDVAGPDKWLLCRGRTMTKIPPDKLFPSQGTSPAVSLKGPGLGGRIRNWFLAGIIVAGPLATTAYIVWWFVDTIDNWVKRLVPVRFWPDNYLPFQLPGLGVVFALLGLTLLGFLAANLVGRSSSGSAKRCSLTCRSSVRSIKAPNRSSKPRFLNPAPRSAGWG